MKKIFLMLGLFLINSSLFANENIIKGEELYKKCITCHGSIGEKSALNKSQKINEWSKEKIVESLIGYQKDTYGGTMKMVMKGQIKDYSEQDIKNIRDYLENKNKK